MARKPSKNSCQDQTACEIRTARRPRQFGPHHLPCGGYGRQGAAGVAQQGSQAVRGRALER